MTTSRPRCGSPAHLALVQLYRQSTDPLFALPIERQRARDVSGRRSLQKNRVKVMAHGVSMRSRGPWQFPNCAPCIIEADWMVRLWNINPVDVLPADQQEGLSERVLGLGTACGMVGTKRAPSEPSTAPRSLVDGERLLTGADAKFGGMDVSDAKRLKALEEGNAKLKWLYADAMLDNARLKELLAKNV